MQLWWQTGAEGNLYELDKNSETVYQIKGGVANPLPLLLSGLLFFPTESPHFVPDRVTHWARMLVWRLSWPGLLSVSGLHLPPTADATPPTPPQEGGVLSKAPFYRCLQAAFGR